jgi:hypothetical protein
MVVIAKEEGSSREIHIRSDLVGSVVKFDGDHYIVDFVRASQPATADTSAAAAAAAKRLR